MDPHRKLSASIGDGSEKNEEHYFSELEKNGSVEQIKGRLDHGHTQVYHMENKILKISSENSPANVKVTS